MDTKKLCDTLNEIQEQLNQNAISQIGIVVVHTNGRHQVFVSDMELDYMAKIIDSVSELSEAVEKLVIRLD